METIGSFGYKIGRKTRLMKVQYDANLLWQTCVREIYILLKHFGSIDLLQKAFENLNNAKNKPTKEAIQKCGPYKDLTQYIGVNTWENLTRNCQHSFINILDSGYFLNNGEKIGFIFILDFNTNSVRFYKVDYNKNETEIEKATINEIMEFDEMPIKTYTEIIKDTKERAELFYNKIKKANERIIYVKNVIEQTKEIRATYDVMQKANALLHKAENEYEQIKNEYCYFYHRLINLNMIID